MTALFTPVGIIVVVLAILFTEFLLLYASTALGNVDLPMGKWLLGTFVAAAVWAGVTFGSLVLLSRLGEPLTQGNRGALIGIVAGGLGLSWLVLALAFIPVLPTSLGRGMLISVFQLLLRALLYVLIAAAIAVVLAILQIRWGTPSEKRGGGGAPPPALAKAA